MTTLDEGTAVATETDAVAGAAAVGRRGSAAPAGGYRALKRTRPSVIHGVAVLALTALAADMALGVGGKPVIGLETFLPPPIFWPPQP